MRRHATPNLREAPLWGSHEARRGMFVGQSDAAPNRKTRRADASAARRVKRDRKA